MRHAAHKAARVSDERFSAAKALFTSSRGSHTAKAVRMVQLANGEGAVVGLDPAVAEKLNEVAPMTRRAMREAARAAERRSTIVTSASYPTLPQPPVPRNVPPLTRWSIPLTPRRLPITVNGSLVTPTRSPTSASFPSPRPAIRTLRC